MRVLIIEDDKDNADALALYLALNAKKVMTAYSGKQALELMRKGYRPNCVSLDVALPDMSGSKLARIFKDWFHQQGATDPVPILGLTGLPPPPDWPPELPLLVKPVEPEQILMELVRLRSPSSTDIPTMGGMP